MPNLTMYYNITLSRVRIILIYKMHTIYIIHTYVSIYFCNLRIITRILSICLYFYLLLIGNTYIYICVCVYILPILFNDFTKSFHN